MWKEMMGTILVDMDSIIADFLGHLLKIYNSETGESVKMKDINGWDMSKCVKDGKLVMDIFRRPGFFSDLPLISGAYESLKELFDDHFDVYIASYACTPWAAMEKVQWMEKHMPFIKSDNIFLCKNKHMIKADYLIDDGLHNAANYRKAWPDSFIYTIAYEYNDDSGKVYDGRYGDHNKDPFDVLCKDAWGKILADIYD